jgi:hypothetical protein
MSARAEHLLLRSVDRILVHAPQVIVGSVVLAAVAFC